MQNDKKVNRGDRTEEKEHKFDFNGEMIKLEDSCGIFVTMNPGYAGRTELPDNLKVLFRPVSMMIPSYELISKVMLFSEGFQKAEVLSGKMVQLFQLASQQLSQQDHYDFGLRAVKSILVMAGQLKRLGTKDSEEVLLIRAMRDANIPKFLAEDIPLFNALVQDLFPGLSIEETKFEGLESQIKESINELKFEQNSSFNHKIV
jgi:dynein heavy chain, axonemal